MSLRDNDHIVSVRQIPDLNDQLFMLTETGMMIRMVSGQTKETLGKVTKGTRIMELRNADRTGYVDEIIFVARLPANLVDSSDADDTSLEEE
jgi:DNA gyrase/topoisomerase IV subunit A